MKTSTRSLVAATLGFATEEDLKANNFPAELISNLFGPMQVGEYTQPIRFNSGKWYIFKLAEKRLQSENLTLESPGVRQQITQGLTNQRKQLLNTALLETMNEAKIINNRWQAPDENPMQKLACYSAGVGYACDINESLYSKQDSRPFLMKSWLVSCHTS